MDNFLLDCTGVDLIIEGSLRRVFICRFCSVITLLPDIAHNCKSVNAPQALRGAAGHTYYEIKSVTPDGDNIDVFYEKIFV